MILMLNDLIHVFTLKGFLMSEASYVRNPGYYELGMMIIKDLILGIRVFSGDAYKFS